MSWSLRFLGVGSASAPELGSSSAMVERDGRPVLMIDCGQEALSACVDHYGQAPSALFVTHAHMDHVGGMERLFGINYFGSSPRRRTRLYVPVTVMPWLHHRVAEYPNVIAEGGANFWDGFDVVPVSRGFWHADHWWNVFPARHHAPQAAFGLQLAGSFSFTGDTRPIPEELAKRVLDHEQVFHDCGLVGNPSHTGLEDLLREYPERMRQRMYIYHYASEEDGAAIAAAGLRVVRQCDTIPLADPQPAMQAHDASVLLHAGNLLRG